MKKKNRKKSVVDTLWDIHKDKEERKYRRHREKLALLKEIGSESNPSKYQSSSDDDFINQNLPSTSKNTQMRTKLSRLSLVCDKHGISDQSAAAIASAVLKDVGIMTAEDPLKMFD
ncbi:unnamed protein product [Psylliodes chrysocephalus]|uniref:Uncharacterized protein n=1 Tax=Psylliodes chrysocephalus TaxID=3402493 RepID=A0A9P0GFU8_9CUCU|nr:unnamed protein product [Psylliodes chrysocephala]